ncbi:MAG: tRNA 2-thiouridine(34) synthase MnmA [Bacteroidales bacterium]|nr:tRNA 2-thiouridine(34) synthase MnmA [Bacteroidales bacterium]MCF8334005.1 tRNA 2-thiouridine(34) synthase MnmA [Bacteroidales bacterium]
MRIASLVSGGVDSSVTIPLLVEQGYKPTIFYIKIGMENKPGFTDCPSEEDIEITSYIARKYGLEMEIIDLHETYWNTVVKYTIDTVSKGLTPNPDVMCNRMIKFGAFEEKMGHEFDLITTGHYADTLEKDGKKYLKTAADKVKDQTYFLGRITYQQLSKLMFPLGKIENKSRVREIAEEMRLPSAHRPDSQGICFLGKINYREFIKRYLGEKEGPILEWETGKKLGTHQGYWFYTIGQRKGLGLSQGPWFVIKKNTVNNIIYVSKGYDPQSQYDNKVYLEDFQFITENSFDNPDGGEPVTFKIRHTPEFTKGTLYRQDNGYLIISEKKISGIAPGQFGVVYDFDGSICIGSGIISD